MPEHLSSHRRFTSVMSWAAIAALVPLTVMAVATVTTWVGGEVGTHKQGGQTTSAPLAVPDWTSGSAEVSGPAEVSGSDPGGSAPSPMATSPLSEPDSAGATPRTPASSGSTEPRTAPTRTTAATSRDATGRSPESQVLALANQQRVAKGCRPLAVDTHLAAAAAAHAHDMVRRHYFGHTSPDGQEPAARAKAAGYPRSVGENIAVGYPDAIAVMAGWLSSHGHKANILNCGYARTGIGYDPGTVDPQWGQGAWVQVFGLE